MPSPDGLEQRTAEAEERAWLEDEQFDAIEDRAESDLMDIAERRLNNDLAVLL